ADAPADGAAARPRLAAEGDADGGRHTGADAPGAAVALVAVPRRGRGRVRRFFGSVAVWFHASTIDAPLAPVGERGALCPPLPHRGKGRKSLNPRTCIPDARRAPCPRPAGPGSRPSGPARRWCRPRAGTPTVSPARRHTPWTPRTSCSG